MAKCKDCIHYDLCLSHATISYSCLDVKEQTRKWFKNKADVAPVKHGKWIPHEVEQVVDNYASPHWNIQYFRPLNYRCSVCGRIEENQEPFCHCGAKMDLEKD